jgi:putative transposase
MLHDPERHHRQSLRLRTYSYASGVYFVTFCTQDRVCLFGEIHDGKVRLNPAGAMVFDAWERLSAWYPGVETDAVVVMPNHLHGVVVLTGASVAADGRGESSTGNSATSVPRALLSLPQVVQRFKTRTTKLYADSAKADNWPTFNGRLWQRNYYEHIVRSDDELARIRRYVAINPQRWAEDPENPNTAALSSFGATAGD